MTPIKDLKCCLKGCGRKATITSHPIVMPLPEEVKEEAIDFASKSDYKLDDFSIEIYSENGKLTVYFPLKAY